MENSTPVAVLADLAPKPRRCWLTTKSMRFAKL
jgi:hypothetical protein